MTGTRPGVDVVVKLGGGLLSDPELFQSTLDTMASFARVNRTVVVPGGGPFANAVRDVDDRFGLSPGAAHWMAILAMDQYAHLIASRLGNALVVDTHDETICALDGGAVAVLAPYQWLKRADPLPHSWDVTSDSLAAWLAGELGAPRLILVKPPGASEPLVDSYFSRALPARVTATVVRAGEPLHTALAAC
jgi:5-(aminomethyl)-3-furanmethanol phosphate kinase